MYLLSAYSPEYSAIESLFGDIKSQLKDFKFEDKDVLANKIVEIAFKIDKIRLNGYFKRTLKEILKFERNQDWISII